MRSKAKKTALLAAALVLSRFGPRQGRSAKIPAVARTLTALALAAALATAIAACGSGSSTSSTAGGEASSPSSPAGSTPSAEATTTTPAPASTTAPSGGGRGGGGRGTAPSGGSSSSGSAGGIKSILDYGSAAGGAEKAAASAAARSFFAALAARDYGRLCDGLSAGNHEQLQGFLKLKHLQGKGCAAVLKTLLVSPQIIATARKAAHAAITSVRVKGDTAFVLFKPAGGPRSFFVMKRQKGVWKATSLAPGLPLNPIAP